MTYRCMTSMLAAVTVLTMSVDMFGQGTQGGAVPVIQDDTPAVLTVSPAPRTPEGKPDLSGVWSAPSTDESEILAKRLSPFAGQDPVLAPWAAERYEYNHDFRDAGPALGSYPPNYSGRPELDPELRCIPLGAPLIASGWGSVSPSEIIQSPKRVLLFYERDHTIRQIWMDGRKHPEPLDPTWMGHSIGRWDGDTLVVETVGLRTEPWLTGDGHVGSPSLRMAERYRRVDHHTLELMLTLEDPKAFVKPWTRRILRRLRPHWEVAESTDVRCYPGSTEQSVETEFFKDLFVHP